MDGGTENVSTERLRYEPWSRRKDFWLRKNTSRQVRGEVCLDRADLVIDGMTRWLVSGNFLPKGGFAGGQECVFARVPAEEVRGALVFGVRFAAGPNFKK